MFAEVGPLMMDDEILNMAQICIKRSKESSSWCMEANVGIKKSNVEYLVQKTLPINWKLSVSENMLIFTNNENI